MNILGIESSCDESACAIVKDGREVISNVVFSQIPLHQPYGGVVPEVASRAHIEKISGVIKEAMLEGVSIDAVAVTYGPGLASSLIVGLAAAKGLALALNKPLYCINHIEAHLHTPFLSPSAPSPEDAVPALGLAVSGGHTMWIDMPSYGSYKTMGQTLDDAAGEAFDKAAKLLGLGYPGGPVIDKWAKAFWLAEGDREKFSDLLSGEDLKKTPYPENIKLTPEMPRFPKGKPREGTAALAGLEASLCVSFSGLKTALLHYVKGNPPADDYAKAMIAASFQEAVVDALADRTKQALKKRDYKSLVVGGGVSLNARLRSVLKKVAANARVKLLLAEPKFCGDNAAMIAGLAKWRRHITGDDAMSTDVNPSLATG